MGAIQLVNDSVFKNGPVTIHTEGLISGGDQFVLALRTLGSTLVINSEDTITVHESIADDVNSEAIAYTTLLILAFGYWVQTSQPILSAELSGVGSDEAGSATDSRVTRFIMGNTSFSLLMGSVMPVSNLSAYSHQYSPIETGVVLGAYGCTEIKGK